MNCFRNASILIVCSAIAAMAGGPEILQKRCIQCHSSATRMGGLSLETRAESERVLSGRLLERVLKGQMPPGGGLPDVERQELETWIKAGAPWEAKLTLTARPRAGKNWWSLQPVQVIVPPPVAASGMIDRYIRSKLAEKGL